jgi:hypothetical protein
LPQIPGGRSPGEYAVCSSNHLLIFLAEN